MPVSAGKIQLSRMLTVDEVADLLQVHPTTIRRWEKKGQLRSYRFGLKGNLRFKSEDIAEFIEHAAGNSPTWQDEIF